MSSQGMSLIMDSSMVGVNNWPLYTAEQVHNLKDELSDEYCEDFNIVFIFNQSTLFKSNST